MKSLSLFVSAAALLSATSTFAALDCATLPTCKSLGYNDTVAYCPKSSTGEDLAVKCPFDTTQGKCIYEAAIGQIGYFTKAPNSNSGWLLCDGKNYPIKKFPQLSALIGTQFGGTAGNTFNVPDYRGFFLRVYAGGTTSSYVRSDFGTYSGNVNNSLTTPQQEGLPNIRGSFAADDEGADRISGAFANVDGACGPSGGCKSGIQINFNAAKYNSIYGRPDSNDTDSVSHVVPGNMAVYAYIYAGRIEE